MAETDTTYRTVTPYLVVADADAELRFMAAAFGAAEHLCHRNEQNAVMHAEMRIGDSIVMVGQAGEQWKAQAATLYIWMPDVDGLYAKALEAGATSARAPEDMPYGHRNAGVVDGCGVTWWIGWPVK
jgi:PhnB protein